ncbi:MAG TPA: PHP domain-containing protein [Clostridiaceae bacterium]|nr:PHP domain-containing protein [Clostridiaceae bacterium]
MSKKADITHDLHIHSILSDCCHDEEMTPERLLANAIEQGYDTICITDHVWDARVPGASDWYAPQTVEYIMKSLPLPSADGIRFCFGCETEYCGGNKLGLDKSSFDSFDFIIVPVNHFHMLDFIRPSSVNTPEAVANLLLTRLEELQQIDLPWKKVGIAHLTTKLTFKEGNIKDVIECVSRQRLLKIFDFFARNGTGIELNASSFAPDWQKDKDILLSVYRLAKEAGCKFYFGSDAHSVSQLFIKDKLLPVVDELDLSMDDLYSIP